MRSLKWPYSINPNCKFYKELKQEIGFEERLEGAPSRLFLKFRSGTHGLFEGLGRHDKGVGYRNVLIVGLEHVLFECAS